MTKLFVKNIGQVKVTSSILLDIEFNPSPARTENN